MYNFKYYVFVNLDLKKSYDNVARREIYQIYHSVKKLYFLINRHETKYYMIGFNCVSLQIAVHLNFTFVYVIKQNYIDRYTTDSKEGEEAFKI